MDITTPLASLSITHVYYNPNDPISYLCAWLALLPQGLCVVYATLVWSTREAEIGLAFAGQLGCEAVNLVLKRLIKEERPHHRHHGIDSYGSYGGTADTYHLPFRRGYGMPSSHAQFAGYWAITIALFLLVRYRGRRRPHPPPPAAAGAGVSAAEAATAMAAGWSRAERVAATAGVFAVAVLIAWSRIYLHYHTTRQVLVGFGAGLVVGAAWFVATALARRSGLLQWALDLPPARWLRIRDLAAEEDAAQAGWEKWQLHQAARRALQAQATAKRA